MQDCLIWMNQITIHYSLTLTDLRGIQGGGRQEKDETQTSAQENRRKVNLYNAEDLIGALQKES